MDIPFFITQPIPYLQGDSTDDMDEWQHTACLKPNFKFYWVFFSCFADFFNLICVLRSLRSNADVNGYCSREDKVYFELESKCSTTDNN